MGDASRSLPPDHLKYKHTHAHAQGHTLAERQQVAGEATSHLSRFTFDHTQTQSRNQGAYLQALEPAPDCSVRAAPELAPRCAAIVCH